MRPVNLLTQIKYLDIKTCEALLEGALAFYKGWDKEEGKEIGA